MEQETVTLIVAVVGMTGTLLAGFGGAYLNHKWTAERETEDRNIRIRLEKIERAYQLLQTIKKISRPKAFNVYFFKHYNNEYSSSTELKILENVIDELWVIKNIYIKEIGVELIEIGQVFGYLATEHMRLRDELGLDKAESLFLDEHDKLGKMRKFVEEGQIKLTNIVKRHGLVIDL